jgi:hypothetical protein
MHFRIQPSNRLFLAILLLAAGPALSETMTITLDDVTTDTCEEVWYEIGIPLWFTETADNDQDPGICTFHPDANTTGLEGVQLGPARLVVDVSNVVGLDIVQMDITIISGTTTARMFNDGSVVYTHGLSTPGDHIFYLPCLGGDTVKISAHNSFVWEIRLIGDDLVPNEAASFGAVKSIFR